MPMKNTTSHANYSLSLILCSNSSGIEFLFSRLTVIISVFGKLLTSSTEKGTNVISLKNLDENSCKKGLIKNN